MFNLFGGRTPIFHAEAGTDPTLGLGGMNKPRLSSGVMVAGVIMGLILVGGQILSSREDAYTAIETSTPSPTIITQTPAPIATWTLTLYPTFTPFLVATSFVIPPTPTPDFSENKVDGMSVLATWTPGAWMLTKHAGGGK